MTANTQLSNIVGPITLPLSIHNNVAYFTLYYFEHEKQRFACAYLGDINADKHIPLRIESACFFGHIFHSRQCDCGFQLDEAFARIQNEKLGLVIYGIDQDARGLGIEKHFRIYDLRQNKNLDTEAVFQHLEAPLDNRSYHAVREILEFLQIKKIKLLSNNPSRLQFLKENGFEVEREEIEAPLDRFNMATLMLEKEDLGYQWSFQTHAHWLTDLQTQVGHSINHYAGRIVENNQKIIAEWIGSEWNVAQHLLKTINGNTDKNTSYILYLTDYPRLDEIGLYAAQGISFIVVPFTTFPNPLLAEAKKYGIKLQDWARENKYSVERPQWELLTEDTNVHHYARGDERLAIAVNA